MAVLKFNLLALAERQTYVAFMSDLMGHSQFLYGIGGCRSSRSRKIKSNLED